MPTPEEIKKIVEIFLDDWCTEHKEIIEPWHQIVEDLTNAIIKDYCIVPKLVMKNLSIAYRAKVYNLVCFNKEDVENLFGKEMFEEDKI